MEFLATGPEKPSAETPIDQHMEIFRKIWPMPFLTVFLYKNRSSTIGYANTIINVNGVISSFFSTRMQKPRVRPLVYAPASPRKIYPLGKFKSKNPNNEAANTSAMLRTKKSSDIYARKAIPRAIDTDEPAAKPLNPSIMFKPFESAASANTTQIKSFEIK